MHVTPQEAASALAQVEDARSAMRRAVRDHRGHHYLWIWGTTWIVMPLLALWRGDDAARYFPWICLAAGALTMAVGRRQTRQIKARPNLKILGTIVALVGFAAVFPAVLHARFDTKAVYAYLALITMQGYVIGGLWTDTYLLWVGLLVTGLLLLGIFAFPAYFWIWMAVFGGGTLVATGVYVRHRWH